MVLTGYFLSTLGFYFVDASFGLAYLTADYSFREMIVVAFVFGLVFDLGGYQALPVRLVSYPLAMMIIWEYRRHIADSSLALVLLLLIAYL